LTPWQRDPLGRVEREHLVVHGEIQNLPKHGKTSLDGRWRRARSEMVHPFLDLVVREFAELCLAQFRKEVTVKHHAIASTR